MDYRLEVFMAVAAEGGVGAAARRLHLSQPAVTQHIKRLEETMGAALFTRSRSGVTLTPAGVLLLGHAREVARLDGEVARKIHGDGAALNGRLRLGASTTILQYFLPEVLVGFRQRHPGIEIDVIEANTDGIIGALLAQRIDLGLIEAPCRRRDLRVEVFGGDEIVIVAAPTDSLAKQRRVTLKVLAERHWVMRETGSGTRQSVEKALQEQGMDLRRLRVIQELPSTEAIKRVVAAGMGIGFVSRLSVEHELSAGVLALLEVRMAPIRRPFSAIRPQGSQPTGLPSLFVGELTRAAEG